MVGEGKNNKISCRGRSGDRDFSQKWKSAETTNLANHHSLDPRVATRKPEALRQQGLL